MSQRSISGYSNQLESIGQESKSVIAYTVQDRYRLTDWHVEVEVKPVHVGETKLNSTITTVRTPENPIRTQLCPVDVLSLCASLIPLPPVRYLVPSSLTTIHNARLYPFRRGNVSSTSYVDTAGYRAVFIILPILFGRQRPCSTHPESRSNPCASLSPERAFQWLCVFIGILIRLELQRVLIEGRGLRLSAKCSPNAYSVRRRV